MDKYGEDYGNSTDYGNDTGDDGNYGKGMEPTEEPKTND